MAVSRSMRRTSARAASDHSTLLAMGHTLKVFLGQPQILKHLVMRNALAATLAQPLLRLLDSSALFVRLLLIIRGSHGQFAGHRIEYGFQEANNGGELMSGQLLDQVMGVLPVIVVPVRHTCFQF